MHTYLLLPKLLKLASENSANAIIWRICLCCIPFRTKPDQSYHEKVIVLEHVCGWICVCALCMCTQEHMSVCGCLDIGICVGGCSSMCVGDQVRVCTSEVCVCEIFHQNHTLAEGRGACQIRSIPVLSEAVLNECCEFQLKRGDKSQGDI